MKYIIGIIQPDRLDEVLKKLTEEEIHLVTVSNVLGRGRQKGVAEVYRSHKEQGSLLKKVKLEIAVNEAFVEKTIKAITGGAQSGQIGDGKIFVLDLPECIRISLSQQSHQFCAHPGQNRPRRTRRGLAFTTAEPAWKELLPAESLPQCSPAQTDSQRG